MADINQAYAKIIVPFEGLYSNDSGDKGGETVWGIARNIDTSWPGWAVVDSYRSKPGFPGNLKDANLQPLAITYYKQRYWDKLLLDQVTNQDIAVKLFDISVNMGQGIAATFLQRSLNVLNRDGQDYPDLVADGIIGSKTISTLNNHKAPRNVLLCLNALQGARYIAICEGNKTQEKFMNGWIQRVQFS